MKRLSYRARRILAAGLVIVLLLAQASGAVFAAVSFLTVFLAVAILIPRNVLRLTGYVKDVFKN